jgi:hypothetical protein
MARYLTWQRMTHNPEVAGSNPAPATQEAPETGLFCFPRRDRGREFLPVFCQAAGARSLLYRVWWMIHEPAHALLFPYLWVRDRIVAGPYEIISRGALTDGDFASEQVKQDVEGLLKMYEMRGSMANRFGSIVRPREGKIGDRLERDEMRPLRRAVVASLLDRNPPAIRHNEDTQGWHVSTSDNALVYLHQLDGSGRVAVQYGRMVELTVTGLTIGEERSRVHAPSELHAPFLGPDPDDVYLDALYKLLTAGTPAARRLGRTIDLLDLAWRNTTSIDDETRIGAIYSGFEVLLAEDGAPALARALSTLLEPAAPTAIRPIPNRPRGRRSDIQPREVTDLEWWFLFFGFLRHDITHGVDVSSRQHKWNDHAHLFLGETRLRQAIKTVVADAGHPTVLLDPFERIAVKFADVIASDAAASG